MRAFFFSEVYMRIRGRLLRPSTLAERRLLLGHFGTSCIRVPRTHNVFAVARRIERYLRKNEDLVLLRKVVATKRPMPPLSPDLDVPTPSRDDEDVAAAE